MGLRNKLGGGKKDEAEASSQQATPPAKRKGRMCMYGHDVARGKKMCEHRHWVG